MATFITFNDEGIEALDHPTEPNFVRLHGTHARRLNRDWIASIQFNGEMWTEEQMRVARVFAAAPAMLEALLEISAITTAEGTEAEDMAAQIQGIARVAIAKAKGEG